MEQPDQRQNPVLDRRHDEFEGNFIRLEPVLWIVTREFVRQLDEPRVRLPQRQPSVSVCCSNHYHRTGRIPMNIGMATKLVDYLTNI
jgi:hypothetical protein